MKFLAHFSLLHGAFSVPAVITVNQWLPFAYWRAKRAAKHYARRHGFTFIHIKPLS